MLLVCHEYRVMHSGLIFLLTPVVLLRCSLICLIAAIAPAADSNASRPFLIQIAPHLAAPESLWLIDGDEIRSRRHWRLPLSADNKSDCDRPRFFFNCFSFRAAVTIHFYFSCRIFPLLRSRRSLSEAFISLESFAELGQLVYILGG